MNTLTVEQYLTFSYLEKKQYLASIARGKENCRLIGKVEKIEDNYCIVRDLKIINDDCGDYSLFIPFVNSTSRYKVFGTGLISKELEAKGIGIGDAVFLNLVPNGPWFEKEKKYFTIEEKSVVKAEDYQKFCYNLGLSKESSLLLKDFSRDPNQNTILFGNDLKKAYELVLKDITEKQTEQKKIVESIEEANKTVISLRQEYTEKVNCMNNQLEKDYQQKKQELDKKIETIEAKLSHMKKYNIFATDENKSNPADENEKVCIDDVPGKVKHIQAYLFCKKVLTYDISVIQSLYLGLTTDQIIILAGKPGSGKTSIVEGYAEAIDASITLIPVQPNWVDRSDLLGFYNPIEKNYVPTPFLDAVLSACQEAERTKERLFFICLDEMNLSHVEYYFAEFLSKLQTDRRIQLYSKTIYEDVREELRDRNEKFKLEIENATIEKFLAEYPKESVDNYFTLKRLCKMISRYPYEFIIPSNVKFVGTINKDETTKDLSPKVTDRCFFIKLEIEENEKKDPIRKKLSKLVEGKQEHYCKKLDFSYSKIKTDRVTESEKKEKALKEINEKLSRLKISLSNRLEKIFFQLWRNEGFTHEQILDIAIAALVLPKVNVSSVDADIESSLAVLEEICNSKPISISVLNQIRSSGSDELTYWR